jgi:anti-anti-sigma factor
MAYRFVNQFNKNDQYLKIRCLTNTLKPYQLVLRLKGSLEMYNAETFGTAVINTLDELNGLNQLYIDLSSVSFISSSGIGGLIQIMARAKSKHIKIFFLDKQNKFKQVLDLLGTAGEG